MNKSVIMITDSGGSAENLRNTTAYNRLVLVSKTGSGKTTQVPQVLWTEGFIGRGKIFVVEN